MADDSSDLSSLSSLSPVPSEDDEPEKGSILSYFPKVGKGEVPKERSPSPPPRKRSPSPPHEPKFEDNPDIAFIVMFRARFNAAFPKSLSHFGPQELETDIIDSPPADRVESFLCAMLGLVLNRKQDVKSGHYGRALEDAVQSHKSQWPREWNGENPLNGGGSFNTMTPSQRLVLLRTLILWSLSSSEAVRAIITQSYKQNRQEDDINQPLSVQPWGSDAQKRRYFLIEGLDDTHFRVYRESNPAGMDRTWWSVAGDIEELKALADKLYNKDGGPKARKLSNQIMNAMGRFEAGEEKRRKRDYRLQRKRQFSRPEPGFSLYEGRTRGKRAKYTFSDEEGDMYSDSTNRRSTRNTRAHTPAEPVTTMSGRQVRPPKDVMATGEGSGGSVQGDMADDADTSVGPTGRPRRSAAVNHGLNGWAGGRASRSRGGQTTEEEDEDGTDFDGDDEKDEDAPGRDDSDDDEDEDDYNEDEAMVEDDLEDHLPRTRIVKLKVSPVALNKILAMTPPQSEGDQEEVSMVEMPDAPPLEGTTTAAAAVTAPSVPPAQNHTPVSLSGRQATPDTDPAVAAAAAAAIKESTQPLTPSAGRVGPSLAFRGSPEKPLAAV